MGWHYYRRLGSEKEKATLPVKVILKRLLPLFRSYFKYLSIIALMYVLRMVLNLVLPLFVAGLVDSAYTGNIPELTKYSIYFLAFSLALWVIGYIRIYFISVTGQSFIRDLRNKLFQTLLKTKIEVLKKEETGKIVSRVMNDVDVIGETFTSNIIDVFIQIITMLGAFFIMFTINLELTLAILPLIPLIFILNYFFTTRAMKVFRKAREAVAKVTSKVEQEVSGAAVSKTFIQRKERNIREFRKVSMEYVQANVESTKIVSSVGPTMSVIRAMGVALILYLGGSLILQGKLTVGNLLAFYGYLDMFFRPLRTLAIFFNTVQSALAAAERITNLLQAEQEKSGNLRKKVKGYVEFKDVVFGYEPGNPVIKSVSLSAGPGEIVAIVGPTGSGKSTLAKLLLRFYDPWSGVITLDGEPIQYYDLEYLRKVIAYVPQEPAVLSGKVIDNIVASSNVDRKYVEKIISELGVKHIFDPMPNGLETELVAEGKNISKGQKQVISLLRAVVASPKVLVLDEATSNVDVETELRIYDRLIDLVREKKITLIVIAHRILAITGADRIYVLQDGKIVEEGKHEELIRRKGLYYRLWKLQSEGVMEAVPVT